MSVSRFQPRMLAPVATSLLAVLAALLLGAILLWLRDKDPILTYRLTIERGVGTSYGLTEAAVKMAPLLLVGSGLLVALRGGVWNIGVDGQLLMGAFLSGLITPEILDHASRAVALPIGMLAGIAGGALWAAGPALLRAWFGLNEIITTLMLNYLAINFTAWLVKGPAKDASVVAPQTRKVDVADRLPDIPGTDIHIGLIVALVVVIVVVWLFRAGVQGFMLDVMGKNRNAAVYAGYPVRRLTAAALIVSGALAGLAGANDVLGVQGVFKGNWNPGYGFAAFALVYLARLRPLALIPAAALLASLTIGGELASRPANVPSSFVQVLEGLILICLAVAAALEHRVRRRRGSAIAAQSALPEPAAVERGLAKSAAEPGS
jgi:simple sugar transport system permease protein